MKPPGTTILPSSLLFISKLSSQLSSLLSSHLLSLLTSQYLSIPLNYFSIISQLPLNLTGNSALDEASEAVMYDMLDEIGQSPLSPNLTRPNPDLSLT